MPTRTNAPREKSVVAGILRYFRDLPEAHARKVHVDPYAGQAGEPDVDAVVRGRSVKLEVKRAGRGIRDLRPTQRVALERWCRAGALTGVVTSVADVRALLAAYDLIEDEVTQVEMSRVLREVQYPVPHTV